MRLKTLEIKGFKSFADKTVLHFDEGITGVIGPNGCGKSNIVDSIRWVIGEHKMSSLRSENLESLVFNGSRTRSSSGLAEVSLTFENTKNLLPTEFNTVTVTRKFYKSGESEYRLNDVSCRLKDIHNLFMDTGVSTDSYAIIELGMVDDIIKDKDNSRRRMLEQAAGISIYKTRKKEARQKLDATEQDLARIEDLLFEINNQLKTLESQAKKAEKYFEAKKEYRTLSIELAKASLEGFNLTYKDLHDQQETETDRRIQLEAAIALEEATVEQEKVGFVEKERALQSLQHQYNDLVQELRTKENEKNLASQRLHYLKERELNTRDFLDKSLSQLKGLEESIGFSGQQVTEEQERLEESRDRLDDLKAGVEDKRYIFDDKRTATDLLRKENQALQRQQFDAEKNVAVADTSILNLQRGVHQLRDEQAQSRDQITRFEQEKVAKEAELAAKKTELENLQAQHEHAKAQILQTQERVEQLRLQLADEGRKLDARRNEHDLLKSLIDNMEGYPESVKFLHNNKGWNHEAPILSDIIYVKEEYRAAVENVLEPYLNYYVVNNLAEGLQAVHLLDDNKKGKANFFLLDQFGDAASTAPHQPSGTLPSLDVVEVDPRYSTLVHHLLGNVFIAETEDALYHSNGAVVLEKTGKYVKGHYSLTGGSVGLFEGKKIGRAKNLEKLAGQIDAQERVVSGIKEQIQARHQEVAHYTGQLREQAIRQTQQEINQLTNQAYALQNKLENLHSQEAAGARRLEDLEDNLQRTNDNVSDQRDLLERLNAQLEELSLRMQGAEEAYARAEQEYNFSQAQYNEANLHLTRQQSKVTALKQELDFKNNQLRDLQGQVEQNNAHLADTTRQIEESGDALQDSHESLVDLMRRKEEAEHQVNTSEQAYYNLRNSLAEKESELRHKQKSKEQVDFLLGQLKDKVSELKLQLAGIKERLSVEFRVDLDAIIDEERETDTSVEDLTAAAERLKKRMENMGEVNPTAIEAFQEMKKRYEFILEQKNDLVTAKDSLLQTIQEVESTANQKFLDTFNAVRENFQRVFKALFTEEDTADIILENPENLAETTIDIIAKPKGKRPSSITQLSGGEKTLTSTALLFAIYLIKPAPFCILDEVDAPLDDANVGKFTQMIRKFSENSQFIIITHNKTTMSTVDVIYGVTMQEPGVSKLVPVDFRTLSN
ncbi:chromosome segregation protein SMC [Dinghuibacter silviterrae]|uniref:Chromosome partition protein Smc n=1 Tax=Dinghuibacter silviterrae TaxID=1539049 RepID=A0A4R8DHL3_9BACT|nr:chromosome segregation protein SMC [Dinghuibacter silviterrae]TDW97017.1 condensin subunit Smc [Dinghuibacter silviterrae]